MAELLAQPRWVDAAQALIGGCVDLGPRQDGAVALMETVCTGLGDQLYPAFLRVLAEVNLRGEYAARAAVAQTLAQALSQGRLPSGSRAAWGSQQPRAQRRSLGPIEYLCLAAWPQQRPAELSPEQFQTLASAVMELLDCDAEARLLYADHLSAVADDPLDGTMPREMRAALRTLAQSWRSDPDASRACSAFVAGLGRATR
ncbi:hypothetical protein ACS5PN_13215 [Roseateles sp. NT4]|uniref:hypothetical protein n=1 Tax=Roseateles sp. NT4 TaxID=3453715 RepID=UPI003EEEDE4F